MHLTLGRLLDTLRLPLPLALAVCLLGGSLECAVLALRRGLAAAGMRLARAER